MMSVMSVQSGSRIPQSQRWAETMKAFLEQMEVRYGGVRAWLTDHGFGPGEIAQLRAKLRQA